MDVLCVHLVREFGHLCRGLDFQTLNIHSKVGPNAKCISQFGESFRRG